MNKIAILEGLLFAVGDEGLSLEDISGILEIPIEEVKILLKNLRELYENDTRGIRVTFLGEVFKLTTKKEHAIYFEKLIKDRSSNTLSNSALETLAVIAYNAPVTRMDINNLRGIESSYIIRKLLARDLIKVSGKSKLPGSPNLYKTTSEFLDYFGLSSLNDLPKLKETDELNEEIDLFSSTYKDI